MDALGPVRGLGGEAGADRAAGRGRGGEHPDRGADRRDGDHRAELARPLSATVGSRGLRDAPRPGRPRTLDHRQIVAETLKPPPKKLGVTHWSSRLLADRLKVSPSAIQRAWRAYGVKPWKAESFRFSTDPELVGKVTDICGLYLAPPENAIVLCVDEKSQIQALDRTVPILPMQEGPDRAPVARLLPARHLDAVRRAGHRHRPGHRGAQAAAPPPGVPGVPQADRADLPRRRRRRRRPGRAAPGDGQLRRPQAQERP